MNDTVVIIILSMVKCRFTSLNFITEPPYYCIYYNYTEVSATIQMCDLIAISRSGRRFGLVFISKGGSKHIRRYLDNSVRNR